MSRKKSIAILAIILMVLTLMPAAVFGATADDTRISGSNRIETALEIASAGTWGKTVILAAADQANLVDALAAAPLAGQENAPILLTFKASLDAAVKEKIAALGATKVYVIGAVSQAVADEVAAMSGVTVEKLAGDNRIATADAINAKLTSPAGSFVVGFDAIPDALSVASYAAKNKFAIVLTNGAGEVDSSKLVGDTKYIVGGTVKVKDIAGVTRIAGDNRYLTNKAVADTLAFTYDRVYVANGVSLVDALAVAPLAAKYNAFVALASGSDVAAAATVNAKLSSSSKVIAVGGTNAVSDAVKGKVAYAAPAAFAVESVKALNASQLQVKFTQAVEKSSLINSSDNLVPAIEITRTPSAAATSKPNRDFLAGDISAMFATLSSDGMTLTLNGANNKYFDGTYSFYIPAGVTSKDLGKPLGAYTTQFTLEDKTAPEVVSVDYNPATDQIEVVMSELVDVDPTVTVNDGAGQILAQGPNLTRYTFNNTWARGTTITVKVSGAVDFNENEQQGTYTKDIKITMDETALGVTSVTQHSSNVIKVVFNKAIPGTDDEARSTAVHGAVSVYRSGVPVSVVAMSAPDGLNNNDGVRVDKNDPSKRTYLIYLVGAGPNYVFYDGKSSVNLNVVFGEGMLADVYGNTNNEISKAVTMNKDAAGPKVVSVRLATGIASDSQLIVRFDEDVTVNSAAGVTVRKDGVVEAGFTGVAANGPTSKEITLEYGATIPNGNYVIRFDKDAIMDSHSNGCAPQNTDYSITKGTSTTTVTGINTVATNEFEVIFSAEVNNTAIDASSYTLNGSALPAGTDLYFGADAGGSYVPTDKQVVIIKLPVASVNYSSATIPLRVTKVEDKGGLRVPARSINVTVTDNIKPTLTAASLAGNVLTLTFDEVMSGTTTSLAAVDADFIIKGGSTELDTTGVDGTVNVSVDGKKVYITITNVGDSNWNTIKAYSNITIKTRDGSATFADNNGQILQKDIQVTVNKL